MVEHLDARLCLPGHGRTFADVRAHIEANRSLVAERVERVREVVANGSGPLTAFEAVPLVYEEPVTPMNANWWLAETLCYLTHLEREGRARRVPGEPERWSAD